MKEKYGSDYAESGAESESDSESDETEDEDGEELTPALDAAILRTLARIRHKDPDIYDGSRAVFDGAWSVSVSLDFLSRFSLSIFFLMCALMYRGARKIGPASAATRTKCKRKGD